MSGNLITIEVSEARVPGYEYAIAQNRKKWDCWGKVFDSSIYFSYPLNRFLIFKCISIIR